MENKFPEAQFPLGRKDDHWPAKQFEAEGASPQTGIGEVYSKDDKLKRHSLWRDGRGLQKITATDH